MLLAVVFTACDGNDGDFDTVAEVDNTGGLLQLDKTLIGYVVGDNGTYTASGKVYQGAVKTTRIDIYNSFTSATTGSTSNEVLLASIEIPDATTGTNTLFNTSFMYADLIAGLTVDGAAISANDTDLTIGDFFKLRYESTTSNGNVNTNYQTTKVSVGTRFAGVYKYNDADYYRIGVLTYTEADYPAETTIESVDATTYRVVEYFGAFNGNTWYFEIDGSDNITYPATTPDGTGQSGNGQPFITCESNPGDMTNVPCGAGMSNYVIRDNVNGADQLVMTFGYFTAGSGSREFYQVMEKIVD